jgi:hypothetical protein
VLQKSFEASRLIVDGVALAGSAVTLVDDWRDHTVVVQLLKTGT